MTDEERIKSLEDGQTELRKDMAIMATNHAKLDSSLNILIIKLDAKFDDEKDLEKLTKDTHQMVNNIELRLAGGEMERHTETQTLLDPMWSIIRKHDKQFQECSDSLEKRVEHRIVTHITLATILLSMVMGLAVYVYTNDRELVNKRVEDIYSELKEINISINNHAIARD